MAKKKRQPPITWEKKTSTLLADLRKRDPIIKESGWDLASFRKWLWSLADDEERWECVYCWARLTFRAISMDHVVPLSRKPRWHEEPDDFRERLQITCKRCNSLKQDSTHDEFLAILNILEGIPLDEDQADEDVPRGRRVLERRLMQKPVWMMFARKKPSNAATK